MQWELLGTAAIAFAIGALGRAQVAVRVRTGPLARAFSLFLVVAPTRLAWTAFRG